MDNIDRTKIRFTPPWEPNGLARSMVEGPMIAESYRDINKPEMELKLVTIHCCKYCHGECIPRYEPALGLLYKCGFCLTDRRVDEVYTKGVMRYVEKPPFGLMGTWRMKAYVKQP